MNVNLCPCENRGRTQVRLFGCIILSKCSTLKVVKI